jgi:hypothetical protein
MVFESGSVKDVKSVSGPNGEGLSSVVRRRIGKSVNRINGTESNAPTQNEPKASKAPKKERRSPETDPEVEDFSPEPEFSALPLMNSPVF